MNVTHKYVVLGIAASCVVLLAAGADAAAPVVSKKKQQESPALRTCLDGCKVHKKEKDYETCMNTCIETDKSQQTPIFKK